MSFIYLDEARKWLFVNGNKYQRNISEKKAEEMYKTKSYEEISWYYRCATRDCSGSVTVLNDQVKRRSPHSTHYKLSDCELEIIIRTHEIKNQLAKRSGIEAKDR